MRSIVVGLGIQGKKRAAIITQALAKGDTLVGTVDPINPAAQFKSVKDVPLDSYDAAFVCTPDGVKFEILSYLLSHGKHLLVEKPLLTKDNQQILKLSEISKENHATCYTAYNHRFEPHIVNLKSLIDAGTLGKIYLARFFYGNGTARDVRNSEWRDKEMGVLPDLGSHLLDMALFLFGMPSSGFEPWSFNRFENRAYDHVMFAAKGSTPVLEMEATLLSWRNSFSLDVYAEKGSAHINCLCKWGPSTLTVRGRVLPSGKPDQTHQILECADPTWAIEYDHFKKLCKTGSSNLDNDLWINRTLNSLGEPQ